VTAARISVKSARKNVQKRGHARRTGAGSNMRNERRDARGGGTKVERQAGRGNSCSTEMKNGVEQDRKIQPQPSARAGGNRAPERLFRQQQQSAP